MATRQRAVRFGVTAAVALVAVAVPLAGPAAAGGGCHALMGGESATESTGATVELKGMCMSPTVLHVAPGTDVTFVNRDPVTHNVYGAEGLAVSELTLGQSAVARFDRAGTFPFACTIHPGMVGAVVVGDGAAPDAIAARTETVATAPVAARTPLPDEPAPSDSTALVVLVSVVLTLVVGGLGYTFGRRARTSP